jgi:hypothetical protein
MPKLTWQSAFSCCPPIRDGGTMDSCLLGAVEVGRVQKIGNRGAWICWLPGASGQSYAGWKDAKDWPAARAALAARVSLFLDAAGLDARDSAARPPAPAIPPLGTTPTGAATQPDLFEEARP